MQYRLTGLRSSWLPSTCAMGESELPAQRTMGTPIVAYGRGRVVASSMIFLLKLAYCASAFGVLVEKMADAFAHHCLVYWLP